MEGDPSKMYNCVSFTLFGSAKRSHLNENSPSMPTDKTSHMPTLKSGCDNR